MSIFGCLWRPGEGLRVPETGITDSGELVSEHWGQNSSPPAEQRALTTSAAFLLGFLVITVSPFCYYKYRVPLHFLVLIHDKTHE